jgi:predicted transporter
LLELGAFLIGTIISFFFALTTVLTSIGAKKVFRSPTVLNDILFFLGITTLIFAFVIPNITQAATMPLSPISLPRAEELFFTIGGVILIWLLGFFNFKRRWN